MEEKGFCGDCGVEEGELHLEGCDQEICSKCKGQVLIELIEGNRCKNTIPEPYFESVFCCKRCGKIMPALKMVSNEEWKFICGGTYPLDCILCIRCMDFIKKKREEKNGKEN